ncbi:MAG TPA: M56 family metallopeptidase [Bryobacteraceae bacterium]|nr:M56 family metallopeptidase [Bryobacteraceae bacterium]
MAIAILNHLWQSTLFALGAGLLTLAFRENRARVRFGIWFAASMKFLMPFALLMSVGGSSVVSREAARIASPQMSVTAIELSQPFGEFAPVELQTVHVRKAWGVAAAFGIWGCGVIALALMRLRGWRRVRRAVRASSVIEIRGRVEIRSAPGMLEPGVVGWLQPVLLIPQGITEYLTREQLAAVFAHELCHVRRRDNLFAAAHMLVEALFWFHPLVWWVGARLTEERERACDEGVLSLGNDARVYAKAIVRVCRMYAESPLPCVAGVTGANLKRRIEAIMTNRVGLRLNVAKKLLLGAAAVAAIAGPTAVGVAIGVGDAAIAFATPAVPQVWEPVAAQGVTPLTAPVQKTPGPEASAPPVVPAQAQVSGRRLMVMLFDNGGLTAQELEQARQGAIEFVRTKLDTDVMVAVMAVSNEQVKVLQDFTNDPQKLETAIHASGTEPGNLSRSAHLASLESTARMLGTLREKKVLLDFSNRRVASTEPVASGELQSAIAAMAAANVAIYSMLPADTVQPLPIEAARPIDMRVAQQLTSAIDSPLAARWSGVVTGRLPGGQIQMQVRPASEDQVVSIPLAKLSGRVFVRSQIRAAPIGGTPLALHGWEMSVDEGSATAALPKFSVPVPGQYLCDVLVVEESTGRAYGETIQFEVK